MKQVYHKWFSLKEKTDLNKHNYLELKLEDLAEDYTNKVNELTRFLDIKNEFIEPPLLTMEKVNYWKNTMPKKDIEAVNNILGNEIEIMGYTV